MFCKNNLFLFLLVFIPVSLSAKVLNWGDLIIFITASLAILPLAAWMGTATEEITVIMGPSLGGFLNATFGNATELIIAITALKAGLVNVVKASITGSIIGNLLLVMGLAMFLGGLRRKEQTFQPVTARVNAAAMNLAVISILIPTAVDATSVGVDEQTLQNLSLAVAVILILVYFLTLLFSMKTHSYLYDVGTAGSRAPELCTQTKPNVWLWLVVLLASTLFVGIESELLVHSLEVATSQLGLTALFTGVIIVPIIGNAAEHTTAVTVAIRDKMDLSLSVAVGSSMQIALFVAPVLVIAGYFFHQPMDLNFNPFELVAVAVSVLIANTISSDGKSNWLEGTLLLATYAVLGFAFYFHPIIDGIG